jgi:hypothetical protein
MIQADGALVDIAQLSSEFLEQNMMKAPRHPPSSADLASSNIYLFSDIKGRLAGLSFENADELLERVRGVLRGSKK